MTQVLRAVVISFCALERSGLIPVTGFTKLQEAVMWLRDL